MTKDKIEFYKEAYLNANNTNEILDIIPKMRFYEFLKDNSQNYLDNDAINYMGYKITYRELFKRVHMLSKMLISYGVKEHDHVITMPLSSPDGIISILAINNVGGVVHLINPMMSKNEIENHIKDCNAKIAFTYDLFYDEKMKETLEASGIKDIIMMSLTDDLTYKYALKEPDLFLAKYVKKYTNKPSDKMNIYDFDTFMKRGINLKNIHFEDYNLNDDIAQIAYTSGSSGASKAVAVTNQMINAAVITNAITIDKIAPQDKVYVTLPYWINYSFVNSLIEPLNLGVELVLEPIFTPKKFMKRLKETEFNHWNTVPFYLDKAFIDCKRYPGMENIKTIFTGGDFLSYELRDKVNDTLMYNGSNAKVSQGYGLTETLCGFTAEYDSNNKNNGHPFIGNKVKIDEEGQILLAGPTIMKEYFHDKEKNIDAFIYEDGERYYKTGDLGFLDGDGQLNVIERIKRITMTLDDDGHPTKIIPEKIRKMVLSFPHILSCEILVVPDDTYGTRPVLFYVANGNIDEEELTYYLKDNIPKYMVPDKMIRIEQMPLTSSLKPDMEVLNNIYSENKTRVRKRW